MTSEVTVQHRVWVALARIGVTLFRINSGTAWAGKSKRMISGDVLIYAARLITLGFAFIDRKPVSGTPDLCGWTTVEITPAMVGRKVAVFTGIETKESGGGRRRDGQINFVEQLSRAGGIAGFAASEGEALEIVLAWREARAPML